MRHHFNKYLLGSGLGLIVSITPAMPADETSTPVRALAVEDKAQLTRRLESVETLIEKSSAAKQIDASANPDALARRVKARELRNQAAQSCAAQDFTKCTQQLNEAAKALFEGVRLAAPEQLTAQKKRRDFDSRMESVKALLSAQKRIGSEKHLDAKEAGDTRKIEDLMQQANNLAAADKLDDARSALDRAYNLAKTVIGGLRGGDTLVRSLHFASKEEEYHYEIDRNDTHKMLVKMQQEEKHGTSGTSAMAQTFLDRAAQLRAKAEALAADGDYEGGVRMLEDSTKELVRVIRSAGLYIPD